MTEKQSTIFKPSTKDISSKTVFKNPILFCQFIRNYVNHPLLKYVQPENIEDCTERFIPYFGTEFQADTVKRIHIKLEDDELEFYLISLIEHKSKVDYNVTVQLLKYMTCILLCIMKEQIHGLLRHILKNVFLCMRFSNLGFRISLTF